MAGVYPAWVRMTQDSGSSYVHCRLGEVTPVPTFAGVWPGQRVVGKQAPTRAKIDAALEAFREALPA